MNSIVINIRKYSYLFLALVDKLIGAKNNIIVLVYHNIGPNQNFYNVAAEDFKFQINDLLKTRKPITLDDLNEFLNGRKKITSPSFVLTFDDGYKKILNIKDFLNEQGIKPAFFVLSDGDKAKKEEIANHGELLTIAEIKSLINSGWEVGCHGATHASLASLTNKDLTNEVVESKNKLENSLSKKIKYFAYPKGSYTKTVVKLVKKSGYDLALSMDDKFISKNLNKYKIPRIGVNGTHSLAEFQALSSPLVVIFRGLAKLALGSFYLKNSILHEKTLEKRWGLLPRL